AWYRFHKFARRNKAALATASVLGLAVGGFARSPVLIATEQKTRGKGQQNETPAEKQRKKDHRPSPHEAHFPKINPAPPRLALDLLAACPEDLRGWEWHYLMRLCKVEPVVLRDSTKVYSVAFGPDRERIASAGKDGRIKIWNSRTGRAIQEFRAHDKAACGV